MSKETNAQTKEGTDMFKVTGASAAGFSFVSTVNQWSVQLFTVPLSVVGMAAAGTFLSYGYGPKAENRKNIYIEALFITFLAIVLVAVLPEIMGWKWLKPELRGPLAGLIGAAGRFAAEPVIKIF